MMRSEGCDALTPTHDWNQPSTASLLRDLGTLYSLSTPFIVCRNRRSEKRLPMFFEVRSRSLILFHANS